MKKPDTAVKENEKAFEKLSSNDYTIGFNIKVGGGTNET